MYSSESYTNTQRPLTKKALVVSLLLGCAGVAYTLYGNNSQQDQVANSTKLASSDGIHVTQLQQAQNWKVYWHNDQGNNDGVQVSQTFYNEEQAQEFYENLGYEYAKIIVSDQNLVDHYGDYIHTKKCKQVADRENDLIFHDLISEGRYCGARSTPEQSLASLDECQAHCKSLNVNHDFLGYWWKAEAGVCGCCPSMGMDRLTTEWADASTYGFYNVEAPLVEEPPLDMCSVKESQNPMGAYRCSNDQHCKGKRTCNGDGWCEGTDRCEKYHPCHIDESSSLDNGTCLRDSQCKGVRTCEDGYCSGESGCPSEQQCEVQEEWNDLGSSQCTYDFECDGLRTCSNYGWCEGESGCKESNFCLVDESTNPLGSGQCSKHRHCKGKRTCSESGYCMGIASC